MPTKKQFDFGIITIVDEEFEAVKSKLNKRGPSQKANDRTYHEATIKNIADNLTYKVLLLQTHRAGNTSSALAAKWMINTFDTRFLLLVGIAAGDPTTTKLGDLVVASKIFHYEPEKTLVEGSEPRPDTVPCSKLLFDRAKATGRQKTWQSKITEPVPPAVTSKVPNSHWDIIAAGEKVQASGRIFETLHKQHGKIVAIAMEGWGVAEAATDDLEKTTHFIEIRGISDYADSKKADNCRKYAADVAASFAVELIRTNKWPARQTTAKPIAKPSIKSPSISRTLPKINIPAALRSTTEEGVKNFITANVINRQGSRSVRLNVTFANPGLKESISPIVFMRPEFHEVILQISRDPKVSLLSHYGTVNPPDIADGVFRLAYQFKDGQVDKTTTITIYKNGILSVVTNDLFATPKDNMGFGRNTYIDPDIVKDKLGRIFIFASKFWAKYNLASPATTGPLLYNLYFHDLHQLNKFGKDPMVNTMNSLKRVPPNLMAIFEELQESTPAQLSKPAKIIEDTLERIKYEFSNLDTYKNN